MATKGRGTRRGASKPPLTREFRPAQRLGELDPRSLTRRLYELHAAARPGGLDDWPGDGDLWRVLGYTQLYAGALRGEDAMEAAERRVMLVQWIREQADALQLRAIEDGRAAGARWARFTDPLCVGSEQGAYQRARRLAAAVHGEATDRRSPEAARAVEDRRVREELELRRAEHADEDRFEQVHAAAVALLAHADQLPLDVGDDNELHDLAQVLDICRTSRQRASLRAYLNLAVTAVREAADESGEPLPTPARQAVDDAGRAARHTSGPRDDQGGQPPARDPR